MQIWQKKIGKKYIKRKTRNSGIIGSILGAGVGALAGYYGNKYAFGDEDKKRSISNSVLSGISGALVGYGIGSNKGKTNAEEYVKDGNNAYLPVYKFLCFNGEPRIIQTIQNDKQPNESIDYFDTEWKLLKLRQNFPNSEIPLEKPGKLDEMCELARKLAKGHAFLRVDFYVINGEIKLYLIIPT